MERQRFAGFPDVPSVREVLPGFEKPPSWLGFFGPAGLPGPIVFRLHADIIKSLGSAEVRSKLQEGGMAVIGNTPQEFADLIKGGFDVYGKAFKAADIKPE